MSNVALDRIKAWADHTNNPILQAYLAQYGEDKVFSANELNDIRDALAYLESIITNNPGGSINNITEIPNRSYNDLQNLPVLPTNSVVFSDTNIVTHTGTSANTLIKSIPIPVGTFVNNGLYYIRIGFKSTQYSETRLFWNNISTPINQPMPQNGVNFAIIERHIYFTNNELYCVTGTEIKEITNKGGVITPVNLTIANTLDIYSQLFNNATVNYLFFVINKLN